MSYSEPASPPSPRLASPASPPPPPVLTTGITVYGCEPDEAALFRAMAPGLGVLPTITEAAVSEQNVELALGNRCVSVGHKTRITDATLRALSQAGVSHISTRSIGCNHLNRSYAELLGLSVGTVAYSPDSVADYTLMLMLMALRSTAAMLRRTAVRDYRLPPARGRELRDLTVGVVGTGRIGTAVIERLRGFGCRVLTHDHRPGARGAHVSLDQLLGRSDVVTLHTPLTAATHHLLDGQRLGQMKPGAYVVNTGRGALLDTEALLAALEGGQLGGAALDVVEGEEGIFYSDRRGKPVDNELLLRLQGLPNVIVSPHAAYYTDHALADTVEGSLRDCVEFESGRRG